MTALSQPIQAALSLPTQEVGVTPPPPPPPTPVAALNRENKEDQKVEAVAKKSLNELKEFFTNKVTEIKSKKVDILSFFSPVKHIVEPFVNKVLHWIKISNTKKELRDNLQWYIDHQNEYAALQNQFPLLISIKKEVIDEIGIFMKRELQNVEEEKPASSKEENPVKEAPSQLVSLKV